MSKKQIGIIAAIILGLVASIAKVAGFDELKQGFCEGSAPVVESK